MQKQDTRRAPLLFKPMSQSLLRLPSDCVLECTLYTPVCQLLRELHFLSFSPFAVISLVGEVMMIARWRQEQSPAARKR